MKKLWVSKRKYYSLGQRRQLVFPLFLYFLQHFFFLSSEIQTPQLEASIKHGLIKTADFIIFIKSK